MHLGNSIICPVTGITMLAAMSGAAVFAFRNARQNFKKEDIIKTASLSCFVFALQMLNFSAFNVPFSLHIVGAMLLAVFLGRNLAFLSICAILSIQTLLFSDGGLLALGCNVFNMGFLACFVAYPFVYKKIENKPLAIILSSIIALQLGAIALSGEIFLSSTIQNNRVNFALTTFVLHLPLGLIEGLFGAAIYSIAQKTAFSRKFFLFLGTISVFCACGLSNFASIKPDGLEWSLIKFSNSLALDNSFLCEISRLIQEKTAILLNLTPILANFSGLALLSILISASGLFLAKNEENFA